MARTSKSTAENCAKRKAEAQKALQSGLSRAAVVRTMAEKHHVNPRTARRWVAQACGDLYDEATHQPNIETGFVAVVGSLELLSDKMADAGLVKEQIQCLKAVGQLYNQRLAAIERTGIKASASPHARFKSVYARLRHYL